MKHNTRRLVLMTAAATALASPWLAQAKDKADKDKDKGGGRQGGSDTPTNHVPEPETLSLVAVGLVAAWAASRRRKD